LQDPQTAILSEPKPLQASSAATNLNITSKPRPMPNPLLFERQGSLRAPESSTAAAAAFRRQFSLRSYSADSPLRNVRFVLNASFLQFHFTLFISFIHFLKQSASAR
uniref:Ovule protein n=1 Tax=Anisakis simplex TaxID=6269 RepID=A0A0M3JKA6_ANISI